MKESQGIYDLYEILNQIGKGSYASVHKAINRKTGDICAIKKIPSDTSELNNLITEIGIISNSKCKNIVRFLASDYTNKEVLIVMEYCCGGSVKDVMRQLGRTMTEEQIPVILKDVLNGLDYLHSNNKIHRDVKAANILLNQDGIAKLSDFGVSETIGASNKRQRAIIGTLLWLPPEEINQDPNYSTAIDIWSLGITITEMGDGEPPYKDMEPSAALAEIANMGKPAPSFKNVNHWSQDIRNFLNLCLIKDATKRKTARELLDCDIIKNASSNSVIKNLVDEVCSRSCRGAELESSMCKEFEGLVKEINALARVYKERRMKVIRVDQMTDRLSSAQKEFKDLQDMMALRNNRISDLRAQLSLVTEDNEKLERERNDLRSTLESYIARKTNLIDQLDKIREKFT